jgi:hypothetical protein
MITKRRGMASRVRDERPPLTPPPLVTAGV